MVCDIDYTILCYKGRVQGAWNLFLINASFSAMGMSWADSYKRFFPAAI